MRTREKNEDATCPGAPCEGSDFDKKTCNREAELEQELAVLKKALKDCMENDKRPDCEEGKIDVAFLVASSSSMNSKQKWQYLKTWLDKLVDIYKIDGVKRRAALLKWSDTIHTEETIHFKDGLTAAQMKQKIDNLKSPKGGTLGGKALTAAYEDIFRGIGGNEDAYRIAIFLTDGRSFDDMLTPSQKYHNSKIHLTPLYLGSRQSEADAIKKLTGSNLSYENHFFQTNDVHDLASIDFAKGIANCKEEIAVNELSGQYEI